MEHKHTLRYTALFYLLFYINIGVFIPYFTMYLIKSGFSGWESGMIVSSMPLTKFFFTNQWTKLYITSSHKNRFMILSSLFSFIILIPAFISHNFYITLAAVFLAALAKSGLTSALDHFALEVSEKCNIEYGRLRLLGSIGFILGITITGKLIDIYGINIIIGLTLISGIISTVPFFFLHLDHVHTNEQNKMIQYEKSFILFLIGILIYYLSLSAYNNYLSIKVASIGSVQYYSGLIWSIGVIAEIFIMFYAKNLFQRFSPLMLMIVSGILGSFRMLTFGITDSLTILLIVNTLHGAGFGLFHISALKYIQQKFLKEYRLSAQSSYSAYAFGLSSILGTVFSGYLFDLYGVNNLFIINAIISLLPIPLIVSYKYFQKRSVIVR